MYRLQLRKKGKMSQDAARWLGHKWVVEWLGWLSGWGEGAWPGNIIKRKHLYTTLDARDDIEKAFEPS